MQYSQRAAIAVGARTLDSEAVRVQEDDQPVTRLNCQRALIFAFSVELWRINVGDADLFAFEPDSVAIVDTVITGSRGTNGKSCSNQKHASD